MNCTLCDNKNCLINRPCNELPLKKTPDSKSVYLESFTAKAVYEAASEIPKNIPRIEEVRLFIEKMKITKVGVAFCKGLQNEAAEIVEFLKISGNTEYFPVICAYEDMNKNTANLNKDIDSPKITCNPIGQAELLNSLGTGINITIGLCVGHDILFSQYSNAPVTNLVVKDRIYKHRPLNLFLE